MAALFRPSSNPEIRDAKLSKTYARTVIDSVDPGSRVERPAYVSNNVSPARRWMLLGIFTLGFLALCTRVVYLQIAQGAEYRELAEGNRIRVVYDNAPRGVITDVHNTMLVKNVPQFNLEITPSNLPSEDADKAAVIQATAQLIGVDATELTKRVNEHAKQYYDQPLQIVENVEYDQAMKWTVQVNHLSGVEVAVNATREYVNPEAYSHMLGYLGKITETDLETIPREEYLLTDLLGKSGIEAVYEAVLKGTKGREQVEVDAVGNSIEVIAEEPSIPGNNIVLAIDDTLQQSLYRAVEDISKQRNSPGGAAVAIDPNTGYIRALVSYPGFDINAFTRGIDQETYASLANDERNPLFNKAVQGEYPSGSTFKLIVAAAALQEGVVTPSTTVNSTGGVRINQWYFPDWKSGGHGVTDVRKAIAESVNTYFYLAGGGSFNAEKNEIEGGLGIDRINEYARRFGLAEPTQIDLRSEGQGFLPTREWKEAVKKEMWYIGDTYNTSIGQGDVLVTPLQVAMYTSVVANGGTLYKPQLVYQTQDNAGNVTKTYEPIVRQADVASAEALRVVREGMRMAVTDGSGRSMQSLPVTSAVKTGTAQVAGTDKTLSWYTGFLPYENPELVFTVLIEEGGEGTEAAVPAARQALSEYLSR